MKSTGMIRRIDDLGRVVIPKEIRRTMRLREGDPLEIYLGSDGEVVFKKHSPLSSFLDVATTFAGTLFAVTGLPVLICNCDRVVGAVGVPPKEVLDRRVSVPLAMMMESRQRYLLAPGENPLQPVENLAYKAAVAAPILSGGDVYGEVVFLCDPQGEEGALELDKISLLMDTAVGFFKQMVV